MLTNIDLAQLLEPGRIRKEPKAGKQLTRSPPPRAIFGRISRFLVTAIAVTVLSWAELSAASMRMGFDVYSQNAGLRQTSVYAVAEDVYGQVWVGTEAGLHRFDGYRFSPATLTTQDSSIQSNWIYSILPMENGDLLLGTLNRGIVRYRRDIGRLESFATIADEPEGSMSAIRDVVRVSPDELWAATYGDGCLRLSNNGEILGRIDLQQYGADATYVLDLQSESAGSVYAATLGGVFRVDVNSGEADILRDSNDEPFRSESGALHLDDEKRVWVGTRTQGVFEVDSAHTLVPVVDTISDRPLLDVRAVTTLRSGMTLVGTGAGLAVRRPGAQNWEWVDFEGLGDDKVMTLLQGDDGGLWLGTKDGGLGFWNPAFNALGAQTPKALREATVTAAVSLDGGGLVLGTVGASLLKRSGQGGVEPVKAEGLSSDSVMALALDPQRRLWVGTRAEGLWLLDASERVIRQYPAGSLDDTLRSPGVMSLTVGQRNSLWVGTYRGGIGKVNLATGEFHRVHFDAPYEGLNRSMAATIAIDPLNRVWVGTHGQGLFVFDGDTGHILFHRDEVESPSALPSVLIYGLTYANGELWLGTADAGLHHAQVPKLGQEESLRFNPVMLHGRRSNYAVYSVVSTPDSAVLFSADFGLGVVPQGGGSARKLQGIHPAYISEYTAGAGALLEDGRVFFGGRRGYNLFDPRDLVSADASPKLTLTGIETIGDNAKLYPHPEALPALELDHTISVVRFDYALADYAAPEDNRFTFQLEGFDSDWSPLTNRHSSTYTNLDAGDYVFKVRAMNSLGVWSDQVLEVPVRVRPAPWASWWAYTLYAAFFVGLIWLALRWRFREQEREARINQLAYYDQVTGIPNRYLFEARADAALTRAMGAGEAFSVLWLRLVLAPQMSDLLNPEQRDEVARALAARCVRIVHAGFNEPGKRDVARMESLGFAVFVRDQARGEQAQALAERLINVLGQPLTVAEQLVPIAAHIGLAAAPDDGDKLSDLMTYAQAATFDPGPRQQSRIVRYQASMTQTAAARVSLESRLREALAQSILQVYFQPRLNQDGRITGAEALLRWPVADGPWPSPAEFVPLAEQSELIGVLDRYVLRQVCIAMQRWAKQGISAIPIAINMSARSLGPDDLVEDLQALCVDHGISADSLEIELTESAVVADMERVRRSLEALQRAGCKISLDDFGTGYSSLSHLQAFAIDCLKIDRSFVAEVDAGGQPASICQGIISLAQGLGMRVVAEGVETQAQWDTLKKMGCPEMQGFLFSPAVPASELEALLVEPVTQPVSQQ